MATERPTRYMDRYNREFWDFTASQELRLQRCTGCGKYRWPPGPICDQCLSFESVWTEVSGHGQLFSWVVFHRRYHPEYPPPHTVWLVRLDEGPLFIGLPADPAGRQPLREGLSVQLAWLDARDTFGTYFLPAFALLPVAEGA
jgi:uncharacterized OB-fold protein